MKYSLAFLFVAATFIAVASAAPKRRVAPAPALPAPQEDPPANPYLMYLPAYPNLPAPIAPPGATNPNLMLVPANPNQPAPTAPSGATNPEEQRAQQARALQQRLAQQRAQRSRGSRWGH